MRTSVNNGWLCRTVAGRRDCKYKWWTKKSGPPLHVSVENYIYRICKVISFYGPPRMYHSLRHRETSFVMADCIFERKADLLIRCPFCSIRRKFCLFTIVKYLLFITFSEKGEAADFLIDCVLPTD